MQRRNFLKGSLVTSAMALLPSPAFAFSSQRVSTQSPQTSQSPGAPEIPFFTEEQRNALARLADHVYPGAVSLGALVYVENMLNALEFDPPRIYATVQTDTHGKPIFLPLARTRARAWRIRLYGDEQREGLRSIFLTGAQDLVKLLRTESIEVAAYRLRSDFYDSFGQAVLEGVVSLPAYGGNHEYEAWDQIHLDRDGAYSVYDSHSDTLVEMPVHPVSKPDPGPDPHPLSFWTKWAARTVGFFQRKAQQKVENFG